MFSSEQLSGVIRGQTGRSPNFQKPGCVPSVPEFFPSSPVHRCPADRRLAYLRRCRGLAHLCGFGKGGDSCSLRRIFIVSLPCWRFQRRRKGCHRRPRRPHLYKKRKGGPPGLLSPDYSPSFLVSREGCSSPASPHEPTPYKQHTACQNQASA